jgi:hypothetical protein
MTKQAPLIGRCCGIEFRGPWASRNLQAHKKRHARERRLAQVKADAEFRARVLRESQERKPAGG